METFRLVRVTCSRVRFSIRAAHTQAVLTRKQAPIVADDPHALSSIVSQELQLPKIPAHSSQFIHIESPMQFYKTLKARKS